MVVGFAGTAILFLPGTASAGFNAHTLIGFLILQIGCIGWCLGSIYQRRQTTKAHPIVTGAVQQLACSILFAPITLLTLPRHIVGY